MRTATQHEYELFSEQLVGASPSTNPISFRSEMRRQLIHKMHLDLNVLRRYVGDNSKTQQRILLKFDGLLSDSRKKVQNAANDGTLDVVRSACHALKSSSRFAGALELGDLSEQLEAIAAGRAPGPIEPVLARFFEECRAVAQALTEAIGGLG